MGDIIVLGLGLDYRGFDAAERQVEGSLTRLEKKFDSATTANDKLQDSLDDAARRGVKTLASQLGQTESALLSFIGKYRALETGTERGRLVLSTFGKVSFEVRQELGRLAARMDEVADKGRRLGAVTNLTSKYPVDGGKPTKPDTDADKQLAERLGVLRARASAAGQAIGLLIPAFSGAGISASQATTAISGLTASFGPLGIAAGVGVTALAAYTVVGAKVIELAIEGSKLGGEFLDLSRNTGVATEKLLLYRVAAERSGANLEDLTGAIKESNEKIREAADGNEKLSAIYKALGVDARKAATEPAAAFDQLAATVSKIADPVLRAKVANELFGSSGEDLISTFKTLDDEGEALRKRMEALGITFSQDTAKKADAIADELVILGVVFDDLKVKIAAGTAPQIVGALQLIEGAVVKMEPAIFGFISKFIDDFTLAAVVVEKLASGFDYLYKAAGGDSAPKPGAYVAGSPAGRLADRARAAGRNSGVDSATGTLPSVATDPYQALREALARDNKGGGRGAANEERARLNAALALERSIAEQQIAVARGAETRRTQILDAQLQDRLISIEDYYKERARISERALNLEIEAEQDKIKAAEDQIARLQRGGVTRREETEILQAKNRIVGAETKIIELQDRSAAQAQRNAREQALAYRQLQIAAEEVQGQLYELTGNEAQAVIEANDRRFKDLIKQFRANGREEAAKAAEEVRIILNTRATSAGYDRDVDRRQKQLNLDILAIQNDVRLGLVGEGQARERILQLESDAAGQMRAKLETQLALGSLDKDTVARIKEQIELLRQLGRDELDLLRRRAEAGFLNDPAFRDTAQLDAERSRLSGMQSLASEIIALEDRIAHAGEDSALRIKRAHLDAIAELLDADTRAAEERVRNQVRLAEVVSGRVNPERLNDGLLKVLASQKSLQEALEDARANAAQDAFRGLDTVIDRLAEKMGVAGSAVAQLAKDLARLALTKGLDKLLGLSSATGGVKGAIADALGVKRDTGATVADVVGEGALKDRFDPNTARLVEITTQIDRKFDRALDYLRQIELNTENSASCCRSAEERAAQGSQGGSIWGSVLGTFIGAFAGGLVGGGLGGGGGDGESGSGYSGPPEGGYYVGSHGVPMRRRALGGDARAGEPYIVGDGGEPELFIPQTNGYIVPMSKARTAAGSTINVTVNVNGVKDPKEFERSKAQIARQLVEAIADAQRFN
jgi:hypothetical protein